MENERLDVIIAGTDKFDDAAIDLAIAGELYGEIAVVKAGNQIPPAACRKLIEQYRETLKARIIETGHAAAATLDPPQTTAIDDGPTPAPEATAGTGDAAAEVQTTDANAPVVTDANNPDVTSGLNENPVPSDTETGTATPGDPERPADLNNTEEVPAADPAKADDPNAETPEADPERADDPNAKKSAGDPERPAEANPPAVAGSPDGTERRSGNDRRVAATETA